MNHDQVIYNEEDVANYNYTQLAVKEGGKYIKSFGRKSI